MQNPYLNKPCWCDCPPHGPFYDVRIAVRISKVRPQCCVRPRNPLSIGRVLLRVISGRLVVARVNVGGELGVDISVKVDWFFHPRQKDGDGEGGRERDQGQVVQFMIVHPLCRDESLRKYGCHKVSNQNGRVCVGCHFLVLVTMDFGVDVRVIRNLGGAGESIQHLNDLLRMQVHAWRYKSHKLNS